MKKMILVLALSPLLFAACAKDTSNGTADETPADDLVVSIDQKAPPKDGEEVAVITTDLGKIVIKFFPEAAPKAVENFKQHAKEGYYDGVTFHRVIDGFMIQGGDPTASGGGGESIYGEPFEDEFHPDLSNIRGAVSMANAGPKTNGSQFFINQVNNTYLDGLDQNGNAKDCNNPRVSCHTVFGQVIEGLDVVNSIAKVQTDAGHKPLEDIEMTVKIIPYEKTSEDGEDENSTDDEDSVDTDEDTSDSDGTGATTDTDEDTSQ